MKCRNLIAAALLVVVPALAPSQEADEIVNWRWTAVPTPSASERVYELRFNASIAGGYIVYGSDFQVDIGPRPTRLKFDAPEAVTPRGSLQSAGTHRKLDPVFKGEYSYFDGKAQLTQQVAVKNGVSRVSGTIRGQTCREADGTCALFNQRFEIDLP
jgi:hypothetical protein